MLLVFGACGDDNGNTNGADCTATGDTCTNSVDCCPGLPCTIPGGASSGSCGPPPGCASYGQACDTQHPCCDNITCSSGKCGQIIR